MDGCKEKFKSTERFSTFCSLYNTLPLLYHYLHPLFIFLPLKVVHVLPSYPSSSTQKGLEELHFEAPNQTPPTPQGQISQKTQFLAQPFSPLARFSSPQTPLLRQKRQLFKPSLTRLLGRKRQLILKTKRGVYVDNLFNEKVDLEKLEGVEVKLGLKKTEEENGEEDHGDGNGADEMWESLAFASPLMHGIDDRAEHFITRFRADMEVQRILPPSL